MKGPFRQRQDRALDRMFETRSDAWAAVGLDVEINQKVINKAWRRLAVTVPLLVAALIAEQRAIDHKVHGRPHPETWIFTKGELTLGAVVVVIAFGWLISRDLSRVSPAFFKRMDPSTAGTVEFLTRLLTVAATALGALAVAGISLQALAVGGAFTAVVLGLAAQQTLGNLFAGMVLLSARPFRLGERVRLQAGAVGGQLEGTVSSLGLLYTTLARGDDRIMIPNNVVLEAVVVPLREPDSVDVQVSLGASVRLSQIQEMLDSQVSVPTRNPPEVALEAIEGDKVTVRVRAVPDRRSDGAHLADEIIAALAHVTGEHQIQSIDNDGSAARS
jgi:small conductance mechanosensitive channel